jgi:hypothetical protein
VRIVLLDPTKIAVSNRDKDDDNDSDDNNDREEVLIDLTITNNDGTWSKEVITTSRSRLIETFF